MKNSALFFSFLFISFFSFAQNVTGLFSGTLVNDSTKKVQNYELALTDYRGKITGYSYTTFVVNDTFYYSIKRVKGEKRDGFLFVEDEKMLVNNFPQRPDKGVHVINSIPLEQVDTITNFKGNWQTTKTKVFYSIHGSLDLKKDNDSTHSQLINHLRELNVLPQQQTVAEVKVKQKEDKQKVKIEVKKSEPVAIKQEPIPYTQRGSKTLQDVVVASDSLVLSFYDNGVVDGDSISVYINGQTIISQQKLKESAVKRTVQLNNLPDVIQLTLVAENLGTIPPNTGLLIVQDGENRYQINFSADLQTNATLTIRRKK
jgi:hypothetical protein